MATIIFYYSCKSNQHGKIQIIVWKAENVETDNKNLRPLPGHFSPTSGLFRAIGYLEAKLLRFQILIWRIVGFCILLGSGDIRKNVKCLLSVNLRIWKNWKNYNENLQQLPDHFSPSSGLFSTMSYLETKLPRF